jgi:hypothetical protein
MRNDETPDEALDRLEAGSSSSEPFRSSGSGEDYEPSGNWGTERRLDQPAPNTPHGMEGAPSGAGYGGFGPEGDYSGPAGDPNAEMLGQVNADRDRLVDQAQAEGPVRPDRAFTASNQSSATRTRDETDHDQSA